MNNEIKDNETKKHSINTSMVIPLGKLLILLVLSLGLYDVFWFYYKWKYLRDIEGKNFNPLLLTLTMGLPFLNVILPYILFKELLYISTKQNKFFVHFLAFILSFSMAVFLTFLDLKGVYKLFTLLYFLPIFIMQFIINRKDFSNAR